MKAIVYSSYGPATVLKLGERPTPVPAEDQVLVRVHAVEVTKADCELRSFRFPVKWFWLPLRLAMGVFGPRNPIMGSYFSGVVEKAGSAVTKFKSGDAIYGSAGFGMGAYGEYLSLRETASIALKPSTLSFEEAAALPLGALNALHFLRNAQIKKGERVLINGAGGSIGLLGVQIAKAMGAEVTAVDCALKEHVVRSAGADRFINYEKDRLDEGGPRYDVVFDMVAGSSYSTCLRLLGPNGRYLIGNPRLGKMLRSLFTSRFSDKTVSFAFADEKVADLVHLNEMCERGALRPQLDRVLPREQIQLAHELVETEQRRGAIVLSHRLPAV